MREAISRRSGQWRSFLSICFTFPARRMRRPCEALEAPRRLVRIRVRVAPGAELAVRRTLERQSVDELRASRLAWAVDALIVPIISVILLGSCGWFVRRMRQTKRPEQLRLLGIVLALDALFIVAAFLPIGWLDGIVVLAAAVAVLLALIEIGIFAIARSRRWGVPDRHRPAV